jgi:type VI secretion system VasD/TssJ family lipoprotein
VLVAAALSCRPAGDAKPPCETTPAIQALIQVSDVVNVGDGGESWPTTLVVYQLKGATSLDQPLDPDVMAEQGEAVFGDEFIDKRELVAYPSTPDKPTRDKMTISLKPNTTHLVVVAQFREKIGSAWYATMAVPPNTRDDQCAASANGDDPVLPCLYVSLERSELAGGAFAPSGFELSAFETVCAAPSTAKKKPKQTKAKKKLEVPKTPQVPKTPSVPQTPSTPTAPSAPKAPTMPSKPTAPTAPKLPGRP